MKALLEQYLVLSFVSNGIGVMNLRDLIFSQSSALEYQDTQEKQEAPSPPFSPLPFPGRRDSPSPYPIKRDSSGSEDEAVADTDAEKIQRKYIPKHVGRYPLIRHKHSTPKHYQNSPEVCFLLV